VERPTGPELGTFEEWTAAADIDPATIVGWVLWDEAGVEYSSADYQADDLPDDGVQAVKVFHTRKGSTTTYAYGLTGVDPYHLPGATRPKRGTWVTDAEHDRITELVNARRWNG